MHWNSDTVKVVGTILGVLIGFVVLLIGGSLLVLGYEFERFERIEHERLR